MWYKKYTDQDGKTYYQFGGLLFKELCRPIMKGSKEFAQSIGFNPSKYKLYVG